MSQIIHLKNVGQKYQVKIMWAKTTETNDVGEKYWVKVCGPTMLSQIG